MQRIAETIPWMGCCRLKLAPLEQRDVLVASEAQCQAMIAEILGTAQVFESKDIVRVGDQNGIVVRKVQPKGQAPLLHGARGFFEKSYGEVNGAVSRLVTVV